MASTYACAIRLNSTNMFAHLCAIVKIKVFPATRYFRFGMYKSVIVPS